MGTAIVVSLIVVGCLCGLMIYGIGRLCKRGRSHTGVTGNQLKIISRQPRITDNYDIGRAA